MEKKKKKKKKREREKKKIKKKAKKMKKIADVFETVELELGCSSLKNYPLR